MKFLFEYLTNDHDESKPLIYAWYIGNSIYVGKSDKGSKRPLKHYRRNVERYFSGKPYRASNPDGWRLVHKALVNAVKTNQPIRLELVCNVPPTGNIYDIEREWRTRLKADLNG